jgi:hypothetical protein
MGRNRVVWPGFSPLVFNILTLTFFLPVIVLARFPVRPFRALLEGEQVCVLSGVLNDPEDPRADRG